MYLDSGRSHYTGVITIKKLTKKEAEKWDAGGKFLMENEEAYHVVDGQQRLTTISILMQCLVEAIKDLPENQRKEDNNIYFEKDKKSLEEFKKEFIVFIVPPEKVIYAYRLGYEDQSSFNFFRYNIYKDPNVVEGNKTLYTQNIKNSQNFFKDNLKNKDSKFLNEIYEKLTQKIKFNLYERE